ncbi:MAG: hypothetical protein H0W57_10095 [Rubrobacteraceae bacterium]|nr:hypothetical protein [Rubrobacteraceae bacterium]
MKTSMLAFATDLRDEGTGTVLDNVKGRAGVDGLTMAVAYHDARDLFPHNPVRKVRYLEGGAVFFPPDVARYEGMRLQPRVSELARSGDPLGELCNAAGDRGMRINAWAVFLHNDRLGFAHPECATQNAFGDRYLTDLCPSNPDVRVYARTLASDIARYEVSTILSESLQFHGLGHGYHHERYFDELGAVGTYLLGLCFCDHCLEAARRKGVDAGMVHRSVRDELGRRFVDGGGSEDPEGLTREDLDPFGGEQMSGYLDARTETVTSLVDEVATAASGGGTSLTLLDLCGAEKGFATGQPEGEAAPALGWQMGIDAAALAGVCDTVAATGYAVDPSRLNLDLDAYEALIPDSSRLGLVLRPMPPDCRSADNLAQKVALARERGLGRLDFYHYGFCRLQALDWIQQALAPT